MFLRKFILSTGLLLLLFNQSFSQQTGVLRGKVKDASSKELLPGATFQLVNNLAKGTVTDIDGNYSMVLDTGYHQLVCNYIGYTPDTFKIHIQSNIITEKNINLRVVGKF